MPATLNNLINDQHVYYVFTLLLTQFKKNIIITVQMIILCDVILVYVKLNTAITTPPPPRYPY